MRLYTLHKRSIGVAYKHSCCSWASLLVACTALVTIIGPFVLIYFINGDLWAAQLLHKHVQEQPQIAFKYEYILAAEFEERVKNKSEELSDDWSENIPDEEPALLLSSSYPFLNELTEKYQRSFAIKHWTEDTNHDRRPEYINLQFTFPPPKTTYPQLTHISIFLDFEAHFPARNTHCSVLNMPTALIIARLPIKSLSLVGNTEATVAGTLHIHQSSTIQCPFPFGRMEHVTFENRMSALIPANSTDHLDYELPTIRQRLLNNPIHMEFQIDNVDHIGVRQTTNDKLNGNIQLNLRLQIDRLWVRYRTNVWQQLFVIWMQYVAVLVATVWLAGVLLSVCFRRHWVRSWEVVPWKKLY